jgi:hypothetical protein
MFVTRVTLSRKDRFYKPDPTKPFEATVELHGDFGKMELNLGPEVSDRLMALLADEVAAAGRQTAELMTAKCLEVAPTAPALKGEAA